MYDMQLAEEHDWVGKSRTDSLILQNFAGGNIHPHLVVSQLKVAGNHTNAEECECTSGETGAMNRL